MHVTKVARSCQMQVLGQGQQEVFSICVSEGRVCSLAEESLRPLGLHRAWPSWPSPRRH
jgi:hypothetical protein